MAKLDIVPPDFRGPPYESIEKSTQLAIETAHKTIAWLSRSEYLTTEDVKALAECYRILNAAKDMQVKELIAERKYKAGK